MNQQAANEWADAVRTARIAPKTGMVPVKSSTILAVEFERGLTDPAPRRRPAMQWTTERPTQSGLYYFQTPKMRLELDDFAVQVVDVRRYKTRAGLNCTAQGGLMDFSCDVAQVPDGRWAGPLPEPYDGP